MNNKELSVDRIVLLRLTDPCLMSVLLQRKGSGGMMLSPPLRREACFVGMGLSAFSFLNSRTRL